METDITKFLSYEIKKELAERYFGFRKLIEEDKDTLEKDLRHSKQTIGNRIVLDLSRLYILLRDESLIDQFLTLTGLGEKFFYDPYILTSPTIRARVFSGVKAKGLTAKMVVIVNCVEGCIPHIGKHDREEDKQKELAEQERLFFVALTRTTSILLISSTGIIRRGDAARMSVMPSDGWHWLETTPSRFIDILGPEAPSPQLGEDYIRNM